MIRKPKQMSESMILGVVLTLAGGFQDAYSYNCRGQVFANAQTGNIVLLGQNIASGNFQKLHWRQIVLAFEIVMLAIAGLLPQSLNVVSNVLMSFACAMQVDSFRKFRGIPCATTMCIGNMRSGTELLCRYHITKDPELKRKSLHYYFIILVFAIGAAIGAVASQKFGNPAIWIAAGLMLLGFILMFVKEEIQGETE